MRSFAELGAERVELFYYFMHYFSKCSFFSVYFVFDYPGLFPLSPFG